MAKLLRNATTDEYYTDTAMDGEFVTLRIHPEGGEYLTQQGVEEGSRIPAEMLAVLEENEWLSRSDESSHVRPGANESETHAPVMHAGDLHVDDSPGAHLQPRPWMEPENVQRMREETDPALADARQLAGNIPPTPADRSNAGPLSHPEDAAFGRSLWFWLLIAAVIAIVVWGLFETF